MISSSRMASASRRISSRLLGHLADDADGQARARERLPPDHVLRQAQLLTHHPHLVLEEHAQRLHQLEVHVVGQAADVVVRLDHGRGDLVPDSMTSG